MEQQNYSLEDFEAYLDHYEGTEIIPSDVQITSRFMLAFERNKKWLHLNLNDWVLHENHPCPIITVGKDSVINNYCNLNLDLDKKIRMKFELNLHTKGTLIKCKGGIIRFKRKIIEWLLSPNDDPECFKGYDVSIGCIKELLDKKSDKNLYFFVFNCPYRIYLMVQRCDIVQRNAKENKQKIVGSKAKLSIIESQSAWDNVYNNNNKKVFYKLSFYLSALIFNHHKGYVLGYHHYYYKYKVSYKSEKHLSYFYINYKKNKPLKSITKYYSSFNQIEIRKQQKAASPTYYQHNKKSRFDNDHLFWIGFTSSKTELIDNKLAQSIYSNIIGWITNDIPKGIHYEHITNRWKFFIYFRYIYRLKHMSNADIKKQCKIAGGLRLIQNKPYVPSWITDLIQHLKNINFIQKQIEINQIGINLYFNETGKSLAYSSINPHFEHEKFSVVYSISIYSNPNRTVSISFNLKANKSNGDIKIPLLHCYGYKMQSLVYFTNYNLCKIVTNIHIHRSIMVHEFCNSFCLRI